MAYYVLNLSRYGENHPDDYRGWKNPFQSSRGRDVALMGVLCQIPRDFPVVARRSPDSYRDAGVGLHFQDMLKTGKIQNCSNPITHHLQ
ncbi:MAG: hypothetical protein GXO90_05395 [FCB group bacterium]|nr:hypothetical protein [FCB group bacterium]